MTTASENLCVLLVIMTSLTQLVSAWRGHHPPANSVVRDRLIDIDRQYVTDFGIQVAKDGGCAQSVAFLHGSCIGVRYDGAEATNQLHAPIDICLSGLISLGAF